jgi:hypothetical protein
MRGTPASNDVTAIETVTTDEGSGQEARILSRMQSLLAAREATDAALEMLSAPELAHSPGRKHWAEARRLLVDVRGEIIAGLDMWRVAYPENSRTGNVRVLGPEGASPSD